MRVDNKLYKNQGIHVISSIFTVVDGVTKVLLIKRKNEPYKEKWALVGGALYNNESLEEGMNREILEKTNLKNVTLYQNGTFDEKDKIPKVDFRMVAVSYLGIVNSSNVEIIKENINTLDVKWFDIRKVPSLAFSHDEILKNNFRKLKELICLTDILKVLLPDEFTMPELQKLYEGILEKEFDRRNFRKKILSLDIIEDTKKEISINGKKPSKLYRFKKNIIQKKIF